MAVFPHPGCLPDYPTQHRRKISIPLINNPPGKNCLVRQTPQSLLVILVADSLGNLCL
jgi:hypothetical protein